MSFADDHKKTLAEMDAYKARFKTLNDKLSGALNQYLATGQSTDIVAIQQEVHAILTEMGYLDLTTQVLNDEYQNIINRNAETLGAVIGEKVTMSDELLGQLNTIKDLNIADWNQITDQAVNNLTKQIVGVRIGALSRGVALREFEDILGQYDRYAGTWLDTSYAGWATKTKIGMAEEVGIKNYLYTGPDDAITREFCERYLYQTHTLKEWDKIGEREFAAGVHPGPLPVSTYRGGWLCRHDLSPVAEGAE